MASNRIYQKGFTIVELLIVIIVIAILATISIVVYTGIQDRGRNSSAYSLASQVAKFAEIYYSVNDSYPTTAANFTGDADLEGIKVTFGTAGAPALPPSAANFNSVSNVQSQYVNGNRVIYVGSATGYLISYRVGSSSAATITKGTPPSGTYAWVSNENI